MSLVESFVHLFHPRSSNNHRPRIIHPEGFFVLFLIITIASLGIEQVIPRLNTMRDSGGVLGYSSTITQLKVIDGTNKEREKLGLPDLVPNELLSQAAEAKANDMFAHQYWAHYSPSGKSPWEFLKEVKYTYYVAGENLARDFMQSDDMMKAWMNSPTHKENIINPKYHDIGIAVVNGTLNGTQTTLVVQMFGTQLNGIADSKIDKNGQHIEIEQVPVPQISGAVDAAPVPLAGSNGSSVLALSLQRLNLPSESRLLSPLYVLKAIFLAVIILVVSVLFYDFIIINDRKTVRFVGKNFAHIALFLTVSFLILFFKSGNIQ
ncbi:MAG: CAP domain-containing protein [Patescibacteria group bacterium]